MIGRRSSTFGMPSFQMLCKFSGRVDRFSSMVPSKYCLNCLACSARKCMHAPRCRGKERHVQNHSNELSRSCMFSSEFKKEKQQPLSSVSWSCWGCISAIYCILHETLHASELTSTKKNKGLLQKQRWFRTLIIPELPQLSNHYFSHQSSPKILMDENESDSHDVFTDVFSSCPFHPGSCHFPRVFWGWNVRQLQRLLVKSPSSTFDQSAWQFSWVISEIWCIG